MIALKLVYKTNCKVKWVSFRHSHKFGSQTNLFQLVMCIAALHKVHCSSQLDCECITSIFQLCLSIAHRISCVCVPRCPSCNVINTCAHKPKSGKSKINVFDFVQICNLQHSLLALLASHNLCKRQIKSKKPKRKQ